MVIFFLVVFLAAQLGASGYDSSFITRRAVAGAACASVTALLPREDAMAEDAFSYYVALDVASDSNPLGRLTIGLYDFAPNTSNELVQLFSGNFMSSCTPPTKRSTDRENLEARRAYSNCQSGMELGVTYEGSTVWRVAKDERIDFGAVRGKFIGRKEPEFADLGTGLSVKRRGAVSVVKGGSAGFTFTVTPVEGGGNSLGGDAVVVGQVVEGFETLDKLNNIGVVKSGIGSPKLRDKPSRECRYGGKESNCSQYKPLRKTEITQIQVKKA
ncbi:hypothetical protein TrST_g205 [Triparma strigata]|uniref:PPIase cyclophilin-type domain-containing protein n=1 Tax=Triparma strigata TaxID=1606541 RepID=A0A9W7A4K7_9STRA|nr:hypothetical protein TrST_g205 [Triparma strigata]